MNRKFKNIRSMLILAKEMYDEGQISRQDYMKIINSVEHEFNEICSEMENEELDFTLLFQKIINDKK